MRRVLLASFNASKLKEFRSLMKGVDLIGPADAGISELPEETGGTFEENAAIKAQAAAASGVFSISDDSGLEVDALNGAPGVYSARYGGSDLDDEGRYRLLLKELEGVRAADRTARFRCVIAACDPSGDKPAKPVFFSGICEGRIGFEPRGDNGFGYDPVFVLKDGRTMAELEIEEKNLISHRALAVRSFLEWFSRRP